MNDVEISATRLAKNRGSRAKAVEAGRSHAPDYIPVRTLSQRTAGAQFLLLTTLICARRALAGSVPFGNMAKFDTLKGK